MGYMSRVVKDLKVLLKEAQNSKILNRDTVRVMRGMGVRFLGSWRTIL